MPPPRAQKAMQAALSDLPPDLDQSPHESNPRLLWELDRTMRHKDMQHPRQQAILQEERRRLEQVMGQKMQQAAQQQFQQRLHQRLNPRIGTPQDTDQQAFIQMLMQQMQRRHGSLP